MKKLLVMAVQSREKELLEKLLLLGCVEVRSPEKALEDEELAALAGVRIGEISDLRAQRAELQAALSVLDRYAPEKHGLFSRKPVVKAEQLLDSEKLGDTLDFARSIGYFEDQIRRVNIEQTRRRGIVETLMPWASLDMPLNFSGTEYCDIVCGTAPAGMDFQELKSSLAAEAPEAELLQVNADEEQMYLVLICLRGEREQALAALRVFGFALADFPDGRGNAADNIRESESSVEELEIGKEGLADMIRAGAARRREVEMGIEILSTKIERADAAEKLLRTESVVILDGWAPAEKEKELQQLFDEYGCAWEMTEPDKEEYPEVPVSLRNNWFTRPLNMVTEMYSLPAYGSLDPNPLMAPFFIFFYGFMMADMGYGILMMLASLIIMKKAKPKGPTMRHMIPLLGLCGFSTFIMGAATGGFFGDLIPQLVKLVSGKEIALPALFSPLDDALAVLIGSLGLGLAQIFTGMGISMYKQIKRGQVMAAICNEGAWFAVFIAFAAGILLGHLEAALIVIVVILVLTQGYGKKGILGKLMGIFGSLYNNITGYFSDILSYSRLMALMLAGAVIAQVFNTLGGITGNVVAFFIIALIGNALNFALNLLSCFVHDMRLQCLEYFSRFYEDGGKPFRPLTFDTKYVDIVKE